MGSDLRSLTAEQYLKTKNVKQFLHQIVVSLLEARPENIARHVMTFLLTATAGGSSFNSMPPSNSRSPSEAPAASAATGNLEGFPVYGGGAGAGGGGKQLLPGSTTGTVGRRQSTIAPDVLKRGANPRRQAIYSRVTSAAEVKVIPKDESTFAALEATTRKVDLFSFLDDDQRKSLVGAMFRREYSDGAQIIVEGDPPDNFYIIETGQCKVVKKFGSESRELAVLVSGQYFGELALISGSTRNASVIASGPNTICWGLDQSSYLTLLKEHHGQKRQRYRTLLRNVPFLKGLQDYEILLVADALKPVNPASGSAVFHQGDAGGAFFIILEGECSVRKSVDGSEEADVSSLKAGDYFGEVALLEDCPRQATITAGANCKLISLDRKSFHRLLGPCSDLFRSHMQSYTNP
jgi:cAMP-dependent protein kinase regulator